MSEPTPAVERAADVIAVAAGGTHALRPDLKTAIDALTAALTDPDDPDSLARTLWHLHKTANGWNTTPEAFRNEWVRDIERWRAIADGLRMVLTGEGA